MTGSPIRDADVSVLTLPRDEPPRDPGKRAPRRAWLGGIAAAGVCLAGVYWALPLFDSIPDVETAPVRLAGAQVPASALSASGYVVARRQASVASKGTGRLEDLSVGVGSRVKAGQLIARVQQDDVHAVQDQARAKLEVAQAALANAQAELRDAQLSHERAEALLDKRFVSQAEYDAASNRLRRAEAAVRSATATITAAKADVQSADVMLDNTLIRAPFDGTVLKKFAEVGEVVAPMAGSASSRGAVVLIADLSGLTVEAEISESSIAQVTHGQRAEIQLDAVRDRRYAGTVEQIVPTADRSKGTVLVKILIDEPDARVLPEMSAKAFFTPAARPAVQTGTGLLVPSTAIARKDGHAVLYAVEGGAAREVAVEELSRNGGDSEVRGEVSPSMIVILSPPATLRAGQPVRIRSGP